MKGTNSFLEHIITIISYNHWQNTCCWELGAQVEMFAHTYMHTLWCIVMMMVPSFTTPLIPPSITPFCFTTSLLLHSVSVSSIFSLSPSPSVTPFFPSCLSCSLWVYQTHTHAHCLQLPKAERGRFHCGFTLKPRIPSREICCHKTQ